MVAKSKHSLNVGAPLGFAACKGFQSPHAQTTLACPLVLMMNDPRRAGTLILCMHRMCRGAGELAGGACPAALLARAAALQERRAQAATAAPGAREALEAAPLPAACAPCAWGSPWLTCCRQPRPSAGDRTRCNALWEVTKRMCIMISKIRASRGVSLTESPGAASSPDSRVPT